MLIDKIKYRESLTKLWNEVFSDSEEYIGLIFKNEYSESILCFGEIEDNRAVAAFYLLRSQLVYDGCSYNGYYLYAAATLPSHRKKGLMSKLIKEAQHYCQNNNCDFISLVPSEESLYSYYGRFGFETSMYSFKTLSVIPDSIRKITPFEYYTKRCEISENFISFDEKSFAYAADCFAYNKASFLKADNDYCIMYSDGEIVEVIYADINEAKANEKYPYGMIYPINPILKREWEFTDIYMNIALD